MDWLYGREDIVIVIYIDLRTHIVARNKIMWNVISREENTRERALKHTHRECKYGCTKYGYDASD